MQAAIEFPLMSAEKLKLYRTGSGPIVESGGHFYPLPDSSWDKLVTSDSLAADLLAIAKRVGPSQNALKESDILAPIGSQEVWAAGVTYFRSRDARMEESKSAGGGDFYDRVYSAERPELFFKATPSRTVGHLGSVAIRRDAKWSVPEPELVLLVSPSSKVLGYTVGNDMSSRDIEGENPLYLPQAKVYHRGCALGPCILVGSEPLAGSTEIRLAILRGGEVCFQGSVQLSAMKRDPRNLVEYLYRDNIFPNGCLLFTGTGIVPPDSFTLNEGDEIRISIDGIGTLVNVVSLNR